MLFATFGLPWRRIEESAISKETPAKGMGAERILENMSVPVWVLEQIISFTRFESELQHLSVTPA